MFNNDTRSRRREPLDPIPFPTARQRPIASHVDRETDRLFEEFACMSRRIEDLAREFNCMGHFDEHDDRPRAA